MKTLCYYIPYSAKAITRLRKIEKLFNAQWKVNDNEEVTIVVKEKFVARVEKILAPIV